MSLAGADRNAELRLAKLSIDFRSGGRALRIVDGVDIAIPRGETLGLVGESGSGKSTLANAIVGLMPLRARARVTGRITLGATDLLALPRSGLRSIRGRRIAMIPQDPMSSLNPLFTIGAQIGEALTAHGRSRDSLRDTVIGLLERVRIDKPATRIDQYPHELSGGMRQRVVGAIAMACGPEFLLADEPTTALDVTVQAQYLELLATLQRETAMGMLFITHDLGVIARISTRVAVMYAGRIVESGSVGAIFASPRHWYTRALLDSVPGRERMPARLASIAGSPLRSGTAMTGCRFAPRCPAAGDLCRRAEPELATADGSRQEGTVPVAHEVRCHFPIAAERGA